MPEALLRPMGAFCPRDKYVRKLDILSKRITAKS